MTKEIENVKVCAAPPPFLFWAAFRPLFSSPLSLSLQEEQAAEKEKTGWAGIREKREINSVTLIFPSFQTSNISAYDDFQSIYKMIKLRKCFLSL